MSDDRLALVTGGSGTIGSAICSKLGASGYTVAVHTVTNTDRAEATVQQIRNDGGYAAVYKADLSAYQGCAQLIAQITGEDRHVDALVIAAGIAAGGLAVAPIANDVERTVAVNLTSALHLVGLVAPGMLRRKHGRIVAISSVVGSIGGQRGQLAYAASKGGLDAMIRTAAGELARPGADVTCNSLAVGVVPTAMSARGIAEMGDELRAGIPSGRFGTADEVAAAVAFLCSTDASYINGATINIDGGFSLKTLPSQRRTRQNRSPDDQT